MAATETTTLHVLLITSIENTSNRVEEILSRAKIGQFGIETAHKLSEAIGRLVQAPIDAILLDISATDMNRLESLERLVSHVPRIPIVVLGDADDDVMALNAVQHGAQDYMLKGQMNAESLSRSIRYAIERHQLLVSVEEARRRDQQEKEELLNQSLVDELTNLYNRRGFFNLVRPQISLSHRSKQNMYLLFADLDGLKSINDNLGHHAGDQALIETATVLTRTFRKSDIIARISGDEFVVLLTEANTDGEQAILNRLQSGLDEHNSEENRRWDLSMSVGVVRYDAADPCSIDELMIRADELMYEQKSRKRFPCTLYAG